MSELKACPFCGGEAAPNQTTYSAKTCQENWWSQDTFYGVNCVLCGSNNVGLRGYDTPEIAAAHWNTRLEPFDREGR